MHELDDEQLASTQQLEQRDATIRVELRDKGTGSKTSYATGVVAAAH